MATGVISSKPKIPKVKMSSSPKKTLAKKGIFSFFAGAGFLDLGFEHSDFEVVYVNEYHKPFLDAYKHSRKVLGIKEPRYGYDGEDIKELLTPRKKAGLREKMIEARNTYDVIGFIGGPPCPDFSVGGKNRGREGSNGILSSVYVDIVIKQQPDFFLFENVKGLWSTKRHREYYDELKKKLNKAGYILTDSLINSIEYGAPQDRNRVILLGFHKNYLKHKTGSFEFPWHIGKVHERSVLKKDWPGTDIFRANFKSKKPKQVIDEQLTINFWFEKNQVETHPNANDYFTPRAALSKFETIPEGDVHKKSYKRLHRWRYSPTAAYGNNEVHIHPFEARRISAAEALAIQSLPRDYELPREMTLSDKFKAVGNGVPYLAAKGVAQAINHFLASR